MANNNGNNSIIDLSADGICEYSYALYNCEYCSIKTFLSMEMKAMMTTPLIPSQALSLYELTRELLN
jgi:hypothetical protein